MTRKRDSRWIVVAGAVAFVLQLGLADRLAVGPGWPDLALAFVCLVALASGGRHAMYAGAGLGLALDLFGGHWVGIRTLVYAVGGNLLGRLVTPFDERSRPIAFFGAGLTAVGVLVAEAAWVAVLAGGLDVEDFVLRAVPNVVLTAAIVTFFAPYDLGFPRRTETGAQELRELKLWF